MSFSILPDQPPDMQIWDNAAFERSAGFAGEKTRLPLRPVSINISLVPELHWSKGNRSPRLTFTAPLVTALPSKPRMPDADDDDDVEAEIEEIKNEIRLLSARLETLHIKKANKDLRAAISKPLATPAAVTECKKKGAKLVVNSTTTSCCRRQGLGIRQSEKGGNTGKRPKPSVVKASEGRKGPAAVCAKRPVKKEEAANKSLTLRTLLHERRNPVTGKRPAMSDNVEVVAAPCEQPGLEQKRKRRKWSLLPENCRIKGFPFFDESIGPGAH